MGDHEIDSLPAIRRCTNEPIHKILDFFRSESEDAGPIHVKEKVFGVDSRLVADRRETGATTTDFGKGGALRPGLERRGEKG